MTAVVPFATPSGIRVVHVPVRSVGEAMAMQRLMHHVRTYDDEREERTMEGTAEPNWGEEPQHGEAHAGERVGIDVPPDGTTVDLHAEPACDGSTECRAMTHLEGCFSQTIVDTDPDWTMPEDDRVVSLRESDQADIAALPGMRDHDVIGAIRMAMVAASDQHSQVRLIERLLTYAPETHPRATGPTKLLVDAIRDEQAQVTITPGV